MTTEQQDKAWACLPKDTRDKIKFEFSQELYPVRNYLIEIFGYHNLTSDTDPEEMLTVERKKGQDWYSAYSNEHTIYAKGTVDRISLGARMAMLEELFTKGKCLPDKDEQPNSKFEVGQKVVFTCKPYDSRWDGKIATINSIKINRCGIIYSFEEYDVVFREEYLEPYVEETENNNIEEKELNLCELLKDCEGMELYSPLFGKCALLRIKEHTVVLEDKTDGQARELYQEGYAYFGGLVMLYPSEELYKKYPLDAYSAWMEWKDEQNPKYILHAGLRLLSLDGMTIEDYEDVELEVHEIDMTDAAEVVKTALEEFHKRKVEK